MPHLSFRSNGAPVSQTRLLAGSPLLRAFFTTTLLCSTGASTAQQAIQGKPYANNQYGYSFVLPAELDLTRGQAGEATLRSKDGSTTIHIVSMSESRPGFPGNDPDTEGQADAKDCDRLPPPYVLKKQNVVAFSCPKGASIHYQITRFTSTGSVSMDAVYPASEHTHWDPVVARIATSLKRTR